MNEAEYNDRAMSDESDDEDSSSMSGEESDSTERMVRMWTVVVYSTSSINNNRY